MQPRKFCHACGAELHPDAEICPKCGVRQPMPAARAANVSDKKILPAFLLAFFIGVLGIHRFYVGKTWSGIAMVVLSLTLVGLIVTGLWALIDWIMIVTGNFRDSEGKLLKEWS